MNKEQFNELESLSSMLCEDNTSPADLARLETMLREDPAVLAEFVAYLDLHAALDWEFSRTHDIDALGSTDSTEAVADDAPTSRLVLPNKQSWLDRAARRPLWAGIAVASLGLVALLVALAWTPVTKNIAARGNAQDQDDKPVVPSEIATLTDWHRPEWVKEHAISPRNHRISAGQKIAFTSGLIEITYDTGAKVVIEGPAEFVVGSSENVEQSGLEQGNSGYLEGGKLVAHCESPASQGFTIATPLGAVQDLGTEFGVHVKHDGEAELQVFEGKVELRAAEQLGGETKIVTQGGVLVVNSAGLIVLPSTAQRATAAQFVRKLRPYAQQATGNDPTRIENVAVGTYAQASPPQVSDKDLGALAVVTSSNVFGKLGADFLNGGQLGDERNDVVLVVPKSTVTLTFDTSVNVAGYDITKITTYAGWNTVLGGRSNQSYEIELTFVDGSTSTLIGPATFVANKSPTVFWTAVVHTNHAHGVLENDRGVAASGVKAITWKNFAMANAGGGVVYREFDVVGVPTSTRSADSTDSGNQTDQ